MHHLVRRQNESMPSGPMLLCSLTRESLERKILPCTLLHGIHKISITLLAVISPHTSALFFLMVILFCREVAFHYYLPLKDTILLSKLLEHQHST